MSETWRDPDGFTLIETLIAIAVLGGFVLVSGPIVRSVLSSSVTGQAAPGSEAPIDTQFELQALVDRFMLDSDQFGVPGSSMVDAGTALDAAIHWPDAPERGAVRVYRQAPNEDPSSADHAWLVFEWRDAVVMRWTPVIPQVEPVREQGTSP